MVTEGVLAAHPGSAQPLSCNLAAIPEVVVGSLPVAGGRFSFMLPSSSHALIFKNALSLFKSLPTAGDLANELVRHFLIECTPKGVRLKGCSNEPYFGKG